MADDTRGYILLWEAKDLLEALLNKAGQEDDASVTSAMNLVILEQDVGAVQLNCLIDYVMGRCVRVVGILWRNWVNWNATSLLNLLAVELRVIADKDRLLHTNIAYIITSELLLLKSLTTILARNRNLISKL